MKETSRIQSSFILNQNCSDFRYEISVFNTQQGGIQNSRRSRRLTRQGNGFTEERISIISYVQSSRKHCKCKYINIYFMVRLVCWTVKTVPTIKFHWSLTLKRKTKETAIHYFSSVLWNIRIQHQQTSVHWNIHPCVINLAFSLMSNCSLVHAFNISL